MTSLLEYHFRVRRSIPASVALLAVSVLLVPRVHAQVNTPATSAVSSHLVTSTIPSVTGAVRPPTGPVIPPTGPVHPPTAIAPPISFGMGGSPIRSEHHHHHHHADEIPLWYAVPVPYAVDLGSADDSADSTADDQDANYQGGPTVFDRRGAGVDSYVPPVDEVAAARSSNRDSDAVADPGPAQPTLLIFKDGHKLEIVNYAIIGATLFDMTPGHARRVPLAELDLDATRQHNEDRGITFQLPMSSQAN